MIESSNSFIALIYYAGLILSILASVTTVLYFQKPARIVFNKIGNSLAGFWKGSFNSTIIIAGILGAISVSFQDCHGRYDNLMLSKVETIKKGLEQLSSSFFYLMVMLSFWWVVISFLQVKYKLKK